MPAVGKDNIALEKGKQSALMKAVKRVKKDKKKPDIKKRGADSELRGIIILNHVPHGFYEKEMRSYFAQFGKVLRVRVARSKKTGKSRGYAYVEFEFREVAQIAAEAMNNYLMFERLIKCELLPSTANATKIFRDRYIREDKFPKLFARKKVIADQDAELPDEESNEILKQRLSKLQERNKKLAEMGINYQFNVQVEDLPDSVQKGIGNGDNGAEMKDEDESDMDLDSESDVSSPDQDEYMEEEMEVPVKSPGKGRKSVSASPKLQKTPEMKSKSPKPSPKIQKTPEMKPKSPKFSPQPQKMKALEMKPKSPKISTPIQKMKTPDMKTKSPKLSPKIQNAKTPEMKTKSPKASPNVSRNEKVQESSLAQTPSAKVDSKKTPAKSKNLDDLPRISPKMLRSRKSEASGMTPLAKTKFSPKLLRSRKSVGPNAQTPTEIKNTKTPVRETKKAVANNEAKKTATPAKKGKSADLPRISPKMLRSRKSEAAALTPMKEKVSTPAKGKKAGRKSVF